MQREEVKVLSSPPSSTKGTSESGDYLSLHDTVLLHVRYALNNNPSTSDWLYADSHAHCSVLPSRKSNTTLLGSSCLSWSGMYGGMKSAKGKRLVRTLEFCLETNGQ